MRPRAGTGWQPAGVRLPPPRTAPTPAATTCNNQSHQHLLQQLNHVNTCCNNLQQRQPITSTLVATTKPCQTLL